MKARILLTAVAAACMVSCASHRAELWLERARALVARKDYVRALKSYERALQLADVRSNPEAVLDYEVNQVLQDLALADRGDVLRDLLRDNELVRTGYLVEANAESWLERHRVADPCRDAAGRHRECLAGLLDEALATTPAGTR